MAERKIKGPDGREYESKEVGFQNVREHWNEYLLEDGTIIKLKPVATAAFRVEGLSDKDGNPVYIVEATNVLVVTVSRWDSGPEAKVATQTASAPLAEHEWWRGSGRTPIITLPEEMFDRYVQVALHAAEPRQLESGRWYCDLPRCPGVWADGASPKECLDTLEEVLRDWLILKLIDKDRDIPTIDEIDLTVISQRF